MVDDSCVASTFIVDTRTSSCGVVDIRNVYVLPGGRGGTRNEAYPTTSFSYRSYEMCTCTNTINDQRRRAKAFWINERSAVLFIGHIIWLFRNFYPQYSLSAQFRLHDASAAGKYVKGARGVVRRAVTEVDETVGFS